MNLLIVRFLIFLLGLSSLSLGIAVVTHAGEGTSTISSFAYVLERLTHYSIGLWVVGTNACFFIVQLCITRDRWWQKFIGQMSAALLFGFTIDIAMHLTTGLVPSSYLWALVQSLGGSMVVGFGVAALVFARLIVLPVEGAVLAILQSFGGSFGRLRSGADVVIVTAAALTSWIAFGDFDGLGMGTVIAALCSGTFAKLFLRGWGALFPAHRVIP